VFDDQRNIIENDEIRSLENFSSWARLFTTRSIGYLSLALNYRFGQLNVFGYHLFNLLVHIAGGIVVYFLASTILKRLSSNSTQSVSLLALCSALIFTVHPVQTQAVTYIVQRFASLAALFYMATVLFYLKARFSQASPHKEQEARGANRLAPWIWYFLCVSSGSPWPSFCGRYSSS